MFCNCHYFVSDVKQFSINYAKYLDDEPWERIALSFLASIGRSIDCLHQTELPCISDNKDVLDCGLTTMPDLLLAVLTLICASLLNPTHFNISTLIAWAHLFTFEHSSTLSRILTWHTSKISTQMNLSINISQIVKTSF